MNTRIYYTTNKLGWEKKWRLLKDRNGKSFNSLDKAISFVRKTKFLPTQYVGLADRGQMLRGNALWDNC